MVVVLLGDEKLDTDDQLVASVSALGYQTILHCLSLHEKKRRYSYKIGTSFKMKKYLFSMNGGDLITKLKTNT